MTSASGKDRGHEHEGEEPPVVRDRRRINPDGSIREPDLAPTAPAAAAPDGGNGGPEPQVADALAELTDTLQRLKAEYDNYRRRTERERQLLSEAATAQVLSLLLPVLDDVERARSHGDLTGAFGAVGDALTAIVNKLGLESYGTAGEPFDPQLHDAVMTAEPTADAEVTVAAQVFRPGYRHAGRVLRPAQVAVAEPAGAPAGSDDPAGETGGATGGGERTADPTPEG